MGSVRAAFTTVAERGLLEIEDVVVEGGERRRLAAQHGGPDGGQASIDEVPLGPVQAVDGRDLAALDRRDRIFDRLAAARDEGHACVVHQMAWMIA